MALTWSSRRKVLYTSVIGILTLLFSIFAYTQFFTTTATCTDGAHNGTEHGVDCGGACELLCRHESRSPVVLWSRVFQVGPGLYTAAAYVQNHNPGAGAKSVDYSFQLFDQDNLLIVERVGTIDIPPVQTVPFVDPNISVGNRTVARALFAFSEEPVWRKTKQGTALRVGGQDLAADASVLRATVTNESIDDTGKLMVAAVLFDSEGTARAASRTTIQNLARRESQPVIFTWSGGVPNIVRAEITVLPSF